MLNLFFFVQDDVRGDISATESDVQGDFDGDIPQPIRAGLPRVEWLNRSVSLISSEGVLVGSGIVRNCHASDCVDNRPLGTEDVGILVLESLRHDLLPADWKYSVRRWSSKNATSDGVSLYDLGRAFEEQAHARATGELRGPKRQYNTSRVRQRMRSEKLERLTSDQALWEVASKTCCLRRCTRRISVDVVKSLRHEMWSSDHKLRSHIKLEVHRHVRRGGDRKYVTLENDEVCLKGWMIIMAVSKTEFYRQRANAGLGVRSNHHGNRGMKKRRPGTRQASASLACIINASADLMPHRFRTLPSGERVVERVLPAGTKWKDIRERLNEVSVFAVCFSAVSCPFLQAIEII